MTNEQKVLELSRLNPKLKLWETPGFSQFIEDLDNLKGTECSIKDVVGSLKNIYLRRLEELTPQGKLKQIKLEL